MPLRLPARRAQKYHTKPTHLDGVRFHSAGEAQRFGQLQLLEKAGKIWCLERQVEMPLHVNDVKIGDWICDFRYLEFDDQRVSHYVFEDYKGYDVPFQKWKRKHAEAQYGIQVRLTGRRKR